jgi:hypothetical protein
MELIGRAVRRGMMQQLSQPLSEVGSDQQLQIIKHIQCASHGLRKLHKLESNRTPPRV